MSARVWAIALAASALSCATLLGLSEQRLGSPFAHRAHLVEGVSCQRCHAGLASAGDEDPVLRPSDDTCRSCHRAPHEPAQCLGCHSSADVSVRSVQARTHLRFAHRQHLPVVKGNCARCHEARDDRGMISKMGTCMSCHTHQDEWQQRRCEPCHVDVSTENVRPQSHLVHGPDYLAAHGVDAATSRDLCDTCHSERSCARCHAASAPLLDARHRFDQPVRARLHPAGFALRHALEARNLPGTCASCHAVESCAECHRASGLEASGVLRRGPHPPGWVGLRAADNAHGPAARRDPMSCASCHGGAGEQLCVDCHAVGGVGGSPHPLGWSSQKPLSETPCRLCHLGSR